MYGAFRAARANHRSPAAARERNATHGYSHLVTTDRHTQNSKQRMLPVIELPFGFAVRSYFAMLALATVVCWVIGPVWARRLDGIPPVATLRALALLGIAAFAGARLHHVAVNWPFFAVAPLAILRFWSGLHAPGAIVGMVLAAPWVLRRPGIAVGRFVDALVPTIGIGIAVARMGCFLNGCCYGIPCHWPWCISFPPTPAAAGVFQGGIGTGGTPVHPLQLYFATTGLLITAAGIWRLHRRRYEGEPALLALLIFSASSAFFELLRAKTAARVYWGPLPQLAWVTLTMTAGALAVLVIAEGGHRRRGREVAAAPA